MKHRLAVVLLGALLTAWGCSDDAAEISEPPSALVAVIAHPDDEVTFGPLLPHYAKQGVEVYMVCVTSGQQGSGNTDIPAGDELAAAREAEITAAAVQYGINPPRLLQLQDGQVDSLSDTEIDDLKTRLRDIFEEVGAQIVITFGPEGITGHADHIAVGAITTELVGEMQAEANNDRAPEKLSAAGDLDYRIRGLEAGADDYVAKPFSTQELVLRLQAVLRRTHATPRPSLTTLRLEDVVVDFGSHEVRCARRAAILTAAELEILGVLMERAGAIVSRDELSGLALQRPSGPFDRSLDVHMSRIRRKLGPRADGLPRIKTIRGEGYLFVQPST